MYSHKTRSGNKATLLAGIIASSIFVVQAGAQSAAPAGNSTYRPSRFSRRATMYYEGVWGVDSLRVKLMESGLIIRFAWRVLDPDKAKELHDKESVPSLIDWGAGARLVVPEVDQVGQLRQVSAPASGRSYWMAFSNKGRLVKPGDRVSVVVGKFRADGLVVE